MTSHIKDFGTTSDGRKVQAVHLDDGELRATILTYGATLQDLRLAGTPWPLTLGAESLAAYESTFTYFGQIVGPVANRIAGASAEIDGRRFNFDKNERGRTTLHSGTGGTHAQVWHIEAVDITSVTLRLDLPDGMGGFPGNRILRACFTILAPSSLRLTLVASSDTATLMNLANHSYWNLDGHADTRGHRLTVEAESYLPTDADQIPLRPQIVSKTNYDFRIPRSLDGKVPLDHNFCLAPERRNLTRAAVLEGARGVRMTLDTTAPGLQVYDGCGLATSPWPGLTGVPYGPYAGIALEAQDWPDATGHEDFPSILLEPHKEYRQETVFYFCRSETG